MKWLLLVALAAAAPAKKAKKATPAANAAADAAIKKALDGEQQHIADCVVAEAPQGAWSLTVKAAVSINSAGQVMGTKISFEPAAGGSEKVRACVDKVLRAVSYPKSAAPLIDISREWAFAMK